MRILAALAAMMTFVAPSTGATHVPGPDNEAAVDAFDCWIELQEVDQEGDPCLPSDSDIELVLVFEIDELTGEVFGPVDLLMVANTQYGEEVLAQIERELAVESMFDAESWHDFRSPTIPTWEPFDLTMMDGATIIHDSKNLDVVDIGQSPATQPFMTTICEAKSRPTSPPPEKKPCYPNDPAITNDEALRLLEGLTEKLRQETSIRPTPREKPRRGGHSTFIQNQGRRHGMTPGA